MSFTPRTMTSLAKTAYNLRPRMVQFSTEALVVRHDLKEQEFVVEIGKSEFVFHGSHAWFLTFIAITSFTDKAYLAYDTTKTGSVIMHHTEVPSAFRGKGVAKILAKVSLIIAEYECRVLM